MVKSDAVLGKDAILGADDLGTEDVYVKQWKGTVRIRAMSGTERDALESATVDFKGKDRKLNLVGLRARMVIASVIDAEGNKVFHPKDEKALSEKSAAALDTLATHIQKLSGMTEDDVEELVGNFEGAPNDNSTSD